MKKIVLAVLVLLLNAATARSAEPYLEEVKALGIVSGQGLACGASKFDTFEMLARAILITKASSDHQQAEGMRVYNEAKADAYISKQMDGFFECAQINRRFDNQLIFRATLYADGTIKMPDGQIFTPRNPYDATLVYKKGDNGRSEAERIYKKRANRRVPAGALQFRTDSAPVSNPDYVPGQSAPAIIEPAGFAGVELQQVNAPAESSVSSSGSSYSGESSIGHIKRSY